MKSYEADFLIVGYGNTMRSDDGVGVVVAEQVGRLCPQVDVMVSHQLRPEQADDLRRYRNVVFVDASVELPAGAIKFESIKPDDDSNAPIGHHLRPAHLLQLCRDMYGRSPQAYQYAVGVGSLEVGDDLSVSVLAAVRTVVDRIVQLVMEREREHA